MRYGYWLPVFGGWLRNVEDEGMEASWNYVTLWLMLAESPQPQSHRGRRGRTEKNFNRK